MKYTTSILLLSITLLTACNVNRVDTPETPQEQFQRQAREDGEASALRNLHNAEIDFKVEQVMNNPNLSMDQSSKKVEKLWQQKQ